MAAVRSASHGELLGATASALDRARAAVVRIDNGDLGATLDLAGPARLLLGDGRGNRLLQRATAIAIEGGIRLPTIGTVTPAPPPATGDLRFGVGSLPTSMMQGQGRIDTPRSIGAFTSRRCLSIQTAETQTVYKWNGLVGVVANKLGGVHFDDEIPEALDELQRYTIAGTPLIPYCLRAATVVGVNYGDALLEHFGRAPGEPLSATVNGVWIGGALHYEMGNGNLDLRVDVGIAEDREEEVALLAASELPSWIKRPNPAGDVDGVMYRERVEKVGRNEPCPCGSGNKYKRCHGG